MIDLNKILNQQNIGILLVEEESQNNVMFDRMFKDLFKYDSFTTVTEKTFQNHWIIRQCYREKLNRVLFDYPRKISYNFLNLPKAVLKYSKRYSKTIVLFLNSTFYQTGITKELLYKLKRKYKNIVWVLYYIDSVSFETSTRANEIREADFFDIVYTMDDADAKRYSLLKFNTPYSKTNEFSNIEKKTDLFFCGTGKNREKLIESIDDEAKKHNAKFNANLTGYATNTRENFKTDFLRYSETIIKSIEANCILEVVADYQHGLTLRPYEAICYNRKLLTNNKAIFDFKYYNPQYMKYFEKLEDINWEWVKDKEPVDFDYEGDFSPIYLVEDIIKRAKL